MDKIIDWQDWLQILTDVYKHSTTSILRQKQLHTYSSLYTIASCHPFQQNTLSILLFEQSPAWLLICHSTILKISKLQNNVKLMNQRSACYPFQLVLLPSQLPPFELRNALSLSTKSADCCVHVKSRLNTAVSLHLTDGKCHHSAFILFIMKVVQKYT